MSFIELKEVTKSFKGTIIFENMNLSLEKGRIYGITGPNGAGKSVLFKLMCGFMFPDSGNIKFGDTTIGIDKRFPESVGLIIDRPGYIAGKNGLDNLVELAMIQKKVSIGDVKETMRLVGLDPENKQKVKHYSLGMKQKLAIAQAIMEDQQTLILDEPFNALDSESVDTIRGILLEFSKKGKTILLTSHNQEDIDYLCDEVYRIDRNNLVKVK